MYNTIMSYSSIDSTSTILNGVTAVDCHKQVRSWRLLRSLLELLIPSCNCTFIDPHELKQQRPPPCMKPKSPTLNTPTTFTGTIFGHRRGKLSFSIQANAKSTTPLLLLELGIPTTTLAREMRGGHLRIALESTSNVRNSMDYSNSNSLLSMKIWNMYCNGRKVGFAVKRKTSKAVTEVLGLMKSVDVGAGVISANQVIDNINIVDDDIMYLRGNFQRVRGSSDCETFHLIDPDGNVGQELSIFFIRSR